MASKAPGKNKGAGRPSRYRPELDAVVEELFKSGMTNVEAAKAMRISETTLASWFVKYEGFSISARRGKDYFDTEHIEAALYKRATGYEHPETKLNVIDGTIVETELTRHYPPDTTALMFWLKNRNPKRWTDKTEVTVAADDTLKDALAEPAKILAEAIGKVKGNG